jgi:hypothetical protein
LRTVLSLVLAVLAGLLASLALVGSRMEAVVHTPGPLLEIAGPMADDPELLQAIPGTVADVVQGQLPDSVPSFLQDGVGELVVGAADGLVSDDRFSQAWASVLDDSRTDWVHRLALIHAEEGAGTAGAGGEASSAAGSGTPDGSASTLHLQLSPVVALALDRLEGRLEALQGGAAAMDAFRRGAEDATADGSSLLVVDLGFPDPDVVSPQALAWVVAWLPRWPWLAGAAVISAVLGLLLAPRGRGWMVLVVTGVTVALSGLGLWWGLGQLGTDPTAGGFTDLARIATDSLVTGLRDYAMPTVVQLAAGGALVTALGMAAALFSRRGADRRF